MSVFAALLGEIKGVFGKEFLFAGLLPASVIVGGSLWYLGGHSPSSLVAELSLLTDDKVIGTIGAAALMALVLALLLFAARSWITYFFESLPGRPFQFIRDALSRRQYRAWLNAKRAEEEQLHVLTVVDKWTGDEDFSRGLYLPSFEAALSNRETKRLCDKAVKRFETIVDRPKHQSRGHRLRSRFSRWFGRDTLMLRLKRQAREVPLPSVSSIETIVLGLRVLFAAAHENKTAWTAEIARWRKLVRGSGGSVVIQVVRDHVHRRWVQSRRYLDRFPIESKWIGPTQLGTKAAALDDYAEKRYGVDTSMLLTRLTGVLADSDREALSDARLTVEVLINLAVAMLGVAAVVLCESLGSIVDYAIAPDVTLLAFKPLSAMLVVMLLVLASIFHRGAIYAYSHLSEKVKRTVDLNRLRLIRALGIPLPHDMDEERKLWAQVNVFFWTGVPLSPSPTLDLQDD